MRIALRLRFISGTGSRLGRGSSLWVKWKTRSRRRGRHNSDCIAIIDSEIGEGSQSALLYCLLSAGNIVARKHSESI
jgi:hypothetical protein